MPSTKDPRQIDPRLAAFEENVYQYEIRLFVGRNRQCYRYRPGNTTNVIAGLNDNTFQVLGRYKLIFYDKDFLHKANGAIESESPMNGCMCYGRYAYGKYSQKRSG